MNLLGHNITISPIHSFQNWHTHETHSIRFLIVFNQPDFYSIYNTHSVSQHNSKIEFFTLIHTIGFPKLTFNHQKCSSHSVPQELSKSEFQLNTHNSVVSRNKLQNRIFSIKTLKFQISFSQNSVFQNSTGSHGRKFITP